MTELLIFEKSLQRIESQLAERCPQVVCVSWQADGSFKRAGQPVNPDQIAPSVGWISYDVMAAKMMKDYCNALQNFDSMNWVQTLNAGLDAPVYSKLSARGIRLSKSRAQAPPIAEYALGYALFHCQQMDQRLQQQQNQHWQMQRFAEIAGSRWLIIGFGHIGHGVALRASAFGASIVAVRQSATNDPLAERTVPLSAIKDELSSADFVVLACPHNDETDQLANAEFFAAMKPGSCLINVARGALVDEQALLISLENQKPARAVLDVFQTEPLPVDSALWHHPQVIVTSHTSNAGLGTRARGDEQFLENLERYLRGDELLDEVG